MVKSRKSKVAELSEMAQMIALTQKIKSGNKKLKKKK